jgi:hypothetical protein
VTAGKTSGSISTGDCLIIEIERGLAKMKEQPPRQLKTVPLTQEHLDSARARLAARSADRDAGSAPAVAAPPGVIVPTASVAKAPPSSVSAMTSAPAAQRAKKSGARGATITVVALGVLAIACAGVAWTSHKKAVVAQVNGAATPASTIAVAQAPAAPAVAAPPSETVGFVVAPRAAAGPEGTPAPASDTKVVKAAEPVLVVPAPPATGAGASPSSPETVTAAAAEPDPAAKRTSRARSRRTAEPVAKPEPAPEPTPKAAPPREAAKPAPPEKTASADEKKPAPAAAPAQPASVDAILQQQLKSAIP